MVLPAQVLVDHQSQVPRRADRMKDSVRRHQRQLRRRGISSPRDVVEYRLGDVDLHPVPGEPADDVVHTVCEEKKCSLLSGSRGLDPELYTELRVVRVLVQLHANVTLHHVADGSHVGRKECRPQAGSLWNAVEKRRRT